MPPKPIIDDQLASHSNLRHGFFTREGGVSEGVYGSLNCGKGSKDTPDNIQENRKRVSHYFDSIKLIGLHQVHSAEVVTFSRLAEISNNKLADALVTNQPDIAISVLTADCVPVLFADPQAGVIAAAHAGWKGALAGILDNTVEAMESLGSSAENIIAVIGPAIAQDSYQVDTLFHSKFVTTNAEYHRFFDRDISHPDHYRFDLTGFAQHRLREAGVGKVRRMMEDTYNQPKRFFSYRRATHNNECDYGRQISAIMLKG